MPPQGKALLCLLIFIYLLPFSNQRKDQFLSPVSPNRLPEAKNRKRERVALLRQKCTLNNNMDPCHGLLVVNGCGVKEREGSCMTLQATLWMVHSFMNGTRDGICFPGKKGDELHLDTLSLRSLWWDEWLEVGHKSAPLENELFWREIVGSNWHVLTKATGTGKMVQG